MFRDEAGDFQKSFRGEIPERCLGHFPGIFIAGPGLGPGTEEDHLITCQDLNWQPV